MTVKSTPKTTGRDRTEWTRVANITVPSAGKFAETAALATAAGVATLGILHAREAQAAREMPVSSPRDMTPIAEKNDASTTVSQSGDNLNERNQGGHEATDHETASVVAPADAGAAQQPPQSESSPPAVAKLSPGNDGSLDTTPSSDTVSTSHASLDTVPAVHDEIVSRLAEQISSSVGNVLTAIQHGNLEGIGQTLAQDIFQTAGAIVQDIRMQLPDIAATAEGATSLIPTTVNAALGNLSGIGHQVNEVISDAGLLDVLNNNAGFQAPALQSAHGLVGELTGLTSAAVPGLATDISATVADIPASLLGGSEPAHGLLAQVFYDDGGDQGLSGGATDAVQAGEPADLGFLGQPLSVAEELTGIFHGSSALHLV